MRIVILGGGFGGLYTALHLERLTAGRPDVEIVLVNRTNYFLMTPLLFEAGSGVLEPRHAVSPIRRMLTRARLVEAEVAGVDVAARQVHGRQLLDGAPVTLDYDQLVVALGGITNRKLIPGSQHALAFKTLKDAIYLRNHVIGLFERADVEPDPARQQALLTFVVIGAGLVGVELMGELTEFVENVQASYRRVPKHAPSFHLVEAGPNVLAEMDRDLADYAARVLSRRGVHVSVNEPIRAIEPTRVQRGDGTWLDAGTIVLAAGVAVNPLLAEIALEKDGKGRLAVEPTLRCVGHPEVWALGDCAAIPDPGGKPYPPLAQHALREAKLLAANLLAASRQEPLKPFVYTSKGTLASLGSFAGVGEVMGVKVRGFLAWWIWRTYYLLQMPRFERRLRIVIDWTVQLLFRNDTISPSAVYAAERESEQPML